MKKTFTKILSVALCAVMMLGAAPLSGFIGLELPSLFDFSFDFNAHSLEAGEIEEWSTEKHSEEWTEEWSEGWSGEPITYPPEIETQPPVVETTTRPVTVPPEIETYPPEIETLPPVVETTTKAPEPEEETTAPTPSYDYSGTCGNNLTWTLNKSTGVLNITGTGAMTNYSSSSYVPWGSYRSYIKIVNISNSVTSIGDYAFYNCTSLKSVTIPDSVTSIGDSAFEFTGYYNNSDNWIDNVLYIGNHLICVSPTKSGSCIVKNGTLTIAASAFFDCDGLTSVTISDSVTTIGNYAFAWCNHLTNVSIPANVKNIGFSPFAGCYKIKQIDVDKHNAYFSTDEYGVLYNKNKTHLICFPCGSELTEYNIPNSVTNIGQSAFSSCGPTFLSSRGNSLQNIVIPNSVTSIGYSAFRYCDSLTSVTIGNSVTSIGNYAFENCDSLTSVTIGNSVTAIGNSAFCGCDSLTSVTIPDSVTRIDTHAFSACESLTSITVSASNKYYSSDSYGVLFNKGKTKLIQYPIGNTRTSYLVPDSVTTIGSSAFLDCESLTSVTIGNSVTAIDWYAFCDCTSLTSVTIPDSVTTIGYRAFDDCDSLKDVYYTGTQAEWKKISIGSENEDLTSATIHFKDVDYSGKCGNNLTWTLNKSTGVLNITGTGAMIDWSYAEAPWYSYRSYIKSVNIGNSVTTIGNYAFCDCTSLTSVTIGNSVTTIGERAFEDCYSLTSVTIPDSVKTIGGVAFYGCYSLTSVTIGNSVTTINDGAFCGCYSLTNVTIPDSVTSIVYGAFCSCDSLTDVYYTGTQEQWNKISIGSLNEDLTSATIHYNYVIPSEFIYSQAHVVGNYKKANADYAAKYFAAMAQPMDGTNGNPDLCVPGLNLGDNMVPQGVAYYEAKNWLLVSAYYNSGNTNTTRPSVIFALDMATGKMVGEYHIYKSEKDENGNEKPYTGHVGGIAVSDYNLYIAYGKKIAYVPLSDLENNWKLVIKGSVGFSDYLDQANVSYLSINDGVLVFGNFYYAYNSKYKIPAKDAKSVILMQRLKGNSSADEWNSVCNPAVTAVVKVPDSVDRIQGVVYRDNKFFISTSVGRDNSSTFYIADLDGSTLNNIYKFQAPPMMEGLTFAGDYIYIVFESAAAFYREGLDGEGKSVNPTDVVWRLDYNEWLGIDNTPIVTGDVENKYVQYVDSGTTGYTYLTFKQNWFAQDSINYNHYIGQLCSQFAMLGYDTPVKDKDKVTGHDYTKPNLKTALEAIGMDAIEIAGDTGETEVNTFIANRKINVNGEEYILVFAGFIGSNYAQWYNNFDPGTGATHKGFLSAKNYGYGLLEAYIQRHGFDKNKTKILITGHSRGAATANLVAAQLIKDEKYATAGNIYTYAFATPNSTALPERENAEFNRIFNIVNPEDFVTKVLPAQWEYNGYNYGRYGTTYVLPSKTNTTPSMYSAYLKNMQRYFYDFTGGGEYHPFAKGEEATYDVVNSLTSVVKNADGLYEKKFEWLGEMTSIQQFFQKTLCAYVGERKGSPKIDEAKKVMIKTFTSRLNSSGTILDIIDYFIGNEGVGGFTNGRISERYFTNAHQAETYCAYMLAMTKTQIKHKRKGYENTVNCPVDIEVIDKATGEVVGKIINNVIDEEIAAKENAIVMSVDGDSKSFWLPSDGDYEVKLIGNDEGTMDYTVAEIDPDLGETERINFFDVEITEGKEMTGDVPAYDFELDEYTLKTDSGEETPDQKLDAESGEITITTSVEGDGYVTNTFTVKSGDYVTLTAQPFVTAKFVKWVDSNGKTLSTDAEYSFVAKENTTVKAVFTTAEGINIKTPSTTTINYGDTLVLQLEDVEVPKGYKMEWSIIGDAVTMSVSEDGKECRVTSTASGNVSVTATLVDENGEPVSNTNGGEIFTDINIKSNASFWQKIVSFFKNLFRMNRIIY